MPQYCRIDSDAKIYLPKLIDFLYHQVLSSGGDGDALWYSRYYNINEIYSLVVEYNSKLRHPWEVRLSEDHIDWGTGQEWILITNSAEAYNNAPCWQECLIKY